MAHIFFSPSYRVHTFNKSMKMVKCAAATPKKKIPPSHSFGIDSLFFLLHSHSLAHSFNSSDTQKTANDSNIQNQFQNETNEFLCDNFFSSLALFRSRSLALFVLRSKKDLLYTLCMCLAYPVNSPFYPIPHTYSMAKIYMRIITSFILFFFCCLVLSFILYSVFFFCVDTKHRLSPGMRMLAFCRR